MAELSARTGWGAGRERGWAALVSWWWLQVAPSPSARQSISVQNGFFLRLPSRAAPCPSLRAPRSLPILGPRALRVFCGDPAVSPPWHPLNTAGWHQTQVTADLRSGIVHPYGTHGVRAALVLWRSQALFHSALVSPVPVSDSANPAPRDLPGTEAARATKPFVGSF